ncbi:MAG: hypothetical protein IIB39_07210 [Candidatus Marinimicrobia bacterium]|nr:hypothetical protein [Candidatus Neomarinimicrobiota bacterium]
MKVLSLNIARRREVQWQGRTIATGFFKEPVSGEVFVTKEGLTGDSIVEKGARRNSWGGLRIFSNSL